MPFIKRSVEPVKIRQGALANSEVSLGEEHEEIVNKSYTQIILQLSQLATFANEIFKDLSQECLGVINRSQKLKTRIWEIDQRTKRLNVLETPLPECSLEDVGLEQRETTPAQPIQDTRLFTAATRPESVQKLYLKSDLTPRAVYAALGPQGWKCAKKFCLTPVLKNPGETTYTITKHERAPYKIRYERNEKLKPPRPRPRSSAPRPQSCAALLDYQPQANKSMLPTPDEHVLRTAKSQPSVLVPIDTSITAFERFAESRASLRNLQSHRQRYLESSSSLNRYDRRRQTTSGPYDLKHSSHCQQEATLSTEKLLDTEGTQAKLSKPKNPDLYIEDNAELFTGERSRNKDKGESVIKKLVRRSRSLPRNIGREKYRETLVPPDFYDINPQHTLIVSQNGAYINEREEKIYTNFYGAPNTELPSPQMEEKMKKSKSDHQIHDRLRSKSSSAMEESKVKLSNGKKRPRSVSAERSRSALGDQEDRKFNSLSRTFTGLFGKGRKAKTMPSKLSTQSRDSISTVFTSNSDGDIKKQGKRLSSQTMLSTQITLRKRDSKATTSSSGRWSGSERFSLDSDGLFSATSQKRLSRASADRDSALGADINDNRLCSDDSKGTPPDESSSLYSVDQDGFYTTMHTDMRLMEDLPAPEEKDLELEDAFADLSLMASSACTSTNTLNEQDRTPLSNKRSSTGSFPDSDQAEEISQRVKTKVEAGRSINRYSLVTTISDDDDDDMVKRRRRKPTSKSIISNLKQSQTYESELDLVLEDLSEAETGTIHSDTESVTSMRISRQDSRNKQTEYRHSTGGVTKSITPQPPPAGTEAFSTPTSEHSDQLLRYRLLNGCTKYQKLPQPSTSSLSESKTLEDDNSRCCKSLPRNMKNVVSNGHLSGLISTLDNMGSWPRKLSRINSELSKEALRQPQTLTKSSTDSPASTQQSVHNKRRSLSPGKSKGHSASNEKTEKIHSLIEEARRMSSMADNHTDTAAIKRPTVPRPLSQPELSMTSMAPPTKPSPAIELVSPYASSNIIDTYSESFENFRRQPSYKIACSNEVTPRKVFPRSHSEDGVAMKKNTSYRQANKSLKPQTSESILEYEVLESPSPGDGGRLVRAPSYKMAQTRSFDRSARAPSYRRALEIIPHESDSGIGSGDLTSSGSAMTSSSESNQSDNTNGRQSSYRAATENSDGKVVETPVQALHHGVIRECMKGVYENEESHLSNPVSMASKPELVRISMKNDSQHYAVPRIPAQPTSFNPTYVNVKVGAKSRQAYKKSLQQSKSAPQAAADEPDMVSKATIEEGKCMTPPARYTRRKARPMSSYVPNECEEAENVVPDNRLMLPKYNQLAFPSMEMLKREEMAVISVLGKIRRSTRPLSYVQTDI